ncbi:Chromosome partition protein Smc [Lacunisphaera limnophila]|uniref:Chromosome partition protein Smc n=1 Tax=Lacunisphaera limnophila TaxID=1838286 RepID=A0A1D8AZY0_9BACT|nr:AAA family ATPase [Lacunisphaera limnophila]AOS46427.1 Chromosome partition protein Smc [Lacunisphaera limnophila]
MKIVGLELSGFRGFAKTQAFDLNADAIIVVGANGNGKTSLFDGILWALCGRIPRLAAEGASVVSLYAESGQARALLTLCDAAGRLFKVTRSCDRETGEARVALETPEGLLSGPSAEGRLLQLVWPEAQTGTEPLAALASVLTRSVYLQQDVLRHFIEPADDHDRFTSVSELFGAGRVTELQGALERAKKAWSTVTNQRVSDLEETRLVLANVLARARELTARYPSVATPVNPAEWSKWWTELNALGITGTAPEPVARDAGRAIDTAIKEIEMKRVASERSGQSLRLLQPQLVQLEALPPRGDVAELRARSVALTNELSTLRQSVTQEQDRQAEMRRMQAELKQKDEQLRVLALLALEHLGDHCPVCAQSIDRAKTHQRLTAITQKGGEPLPDSSSTKLNELLALVAAKEKEIGGLELSIRTEQQREMEADMLRKFVQARFVEHGISAEESSVRARQLEEGISKNDSHAARLKELQHQGEALALAVSQSVAQLALSETKVESERLQKLIQERQQAIASRNASGEMAQRVIEGLREAASAVVEQRLQQVEPLLQNIYSRIDPHPAFETVKFLSRVTKGRGLLSTVVQDSQEDLSCQHPPLVMSSSQVNALAVSIFLSFNFGVTQPPLASLLLDDPLQCLDDVNLLGLVDLLRRTKDRRQLCVSTHDQRFANLLARKLRPADTTGRTIVIELVGWQREGPEVHTREILSDPVPLRLAAS